MRLAVDIETAPAVGFEEYEDAALDVNRQRITLIATYSPETGPRVFRSMGEFLPFLASLTDVHMVFHNAKFDLKGLWRHGLPKDRYKEYDDTQLMAVALVDKIPDQWLIRYNRTRIEAGPHHREAGKYSLKTLAPYHLGVAPFWEVADHNNDEYALKDAQYTYELAEVLEKKLEQDGSLTFYKTKLLRWSMMLATAEYEGIRLDTALLEEMVAATELEFKTIKEELTSAWAEPAAAWADRVRAKVRAKYRQMTEVAVSKAKDAYKTECRYRELERRALESANTKLNLDAPAQLAWLFKDYFKLDITTFGGDAESTAKPVLQRLAQSRDDIKLFLDYRAKSKLLSAFFPSYREMVFNSRLHTNFNMNGTRTGRLSSSGPNLQQCPGHLHKLFVPAQGNKLLCYDLSAIEPTVIAYITEDPVLCDLLLSGGNFHSNNVRVFMGIEADDEEIKAKYTKERKLAKEVGLSLLYGAGAGRLEETAAKYGLPWSLGRCREVLARFKDTYQTVYDYKRQLDRLLESGQSTQNILGRRFKIPDKKDVYMKGFNTLVQGSASDLLLEGAARAWAKFPNMRPRLFVHDEVIMEVPEEAAEEAAAVLVSSLESFNLTTNYGRLPVKAEGGIYAAWSK